MTCARMSLKGTERGQVLRLVNGFPGVACISINEEAVHGIPRHTRTIRDGDLVKLDVTAELNGYFADAAVTVGVGKVSSQKRRLAGCARSALYNALKVARANRPMNGIGRSSTGRGRTPRIQGNAGAWRPRRRKNGSRGAICAQLLRPMGQSTSLARLGHMQ